MKATIITGPKGELVAAVLGPAQGPPQGRTGRTGEEAGLLAGPGQKLHEVTIPEDLAGVKNPEEFRKRLASHMPKG